MLKMIVLLGAILFGFTTFAETATSPHATASAKITQSTMPSPSGRIESKNKTMNMHSLDVYSCDAWTACAGGYNVSCHSEGSYSCHAEYVPGQYAYCEAYGVDGSFAWVRRACYSSFEK